MLVTEISLIILTSHFAQQCYDTITRLLVFFFVMIWNYAQVLNAKNIINFLYRLNFAITEELAQCIEATKDEA